MAIRIRLNWQENNLLETGHRVYRSLTPIDIEDLPIPIATLGPNITEYLDEDVSVNETYYYRVSAYTTFSEKISEEVEVTASAPNWNPLDSSAQLWLDADDVSTISIVSGLVSQWNDKSGNGNHLDQPNSSWRPVVQANAIGVKSSVYIATGKSLGKSSTAIGKALNGISIVVLRRHRLASLAGQYVANSKFSTNNLGSPAKPAGFARRANSGTNFGVTLDDNTNTNFGIFTLAVDYLTGSVKGGLNGFYKNGTPIDPPGVSDNTDSLMVIGGNTSAYSAPTSFNNANFGGDIAELIILPNSADYQKAEGFIAHKWGLTSLLASDHPYKTVAP